MRSQSIRRPSGPVLLSGTVIRVDPDTGLGKTDNPIPATSGTNAHRIVAAGLRNPFRFTVRPGTNDLWIGDVGGGNYEEINRDAAPTAAMQNYGWPCYEGPSTYGLSSADVCTGLSNTQGYYAYSHASRLVTSDPCPTSKGSSISGIAFYGSGSYPSSYNGALFFADHTRNCIWVARAGSDGLPEMSTLAPFYTAQTTRPVDLQIGP